jgi:xylulokinase
VLVPSATELVALGAAAQAAAVVTGEQPAAVARRWNTRDGQRLEAMPRDEQALARIAAARAAALASQS